MATPSVTFECPRCEREATVPTLGEHSRTAGTPYAERGAVETLLNTVLREHVAPPADAGARAVHCPHCAADVPAAELRNVRGEALFACPACEHRMLTGPLAAADVVCCAACGRGFAGGAVKLLAGDRAPVPGVRPASPERPGRAFVVPYTCRQVTKTSRKQGNVTRHETAKWTRDDHLVVVQPDEGANVYLHHCAACGGGITVTVRSLAAARRRAVVAGLFALPAVPLVAWAVHFVTHAEKGQRLGPWDPFLLVLSLIWAVYFLIKVWNLIPAVRRRIGFARCVAWDAPPRSKWLWGIGVFKEANLEINIEPHLDRAVGLGQATSAADAEGVVAFKAIVAAGAADEARATAAP